MNEHLKSICIMANSQLKALARVTVFMISEKLAIHFFNMQSSYELCI